MMRSTNNQSAETEDREVSPITMQSDPTFRSQIAIKHTRLSIQPAGRAFCTGDTLTASAPTTQKNNASQHSSLNLGSRMTTDTAIWTPNFGENLQDSSRLVLGCIDAHFSNKRSSENFCRDLQNALHSFFLECSQNIVVLNHVRLMTCGCN